jgi:hypothetical protein
MMAISYFYKIYKCIQSAKTIHHIESCEAMINNVKGLLATGYLAELALIKKVDLLTTQYQENE